MTSLSDRDIERFWRKVEKSDGCWLWKASRTAKGYGKMRVGDRHVGAHRLAYEIAVGPIPAGKLVCHHCDVRHCVRPAHMFVGTQRDNIRDMIAKGRRSIFAGPRTLTEKQVRHIRAAVEEGPRGTAAQLARDLGVSPATISLAVNRQQWDWVV